MRYLRKRIRAIVSVVIVTMAIGAVLFGFYIYRGMEQMGNWEVGMQEIRLPSGATAYLRRQADYPADGELYLSENSDYCAPYDSWHDYKLSNIIHGAPNSPLFISLSGDTVVIHTPGKPHSPWFSPPRTFKVKFEQISSQTYAASIDAHPADQPSSHWQRVEVPLGQNSCAL